MDPGVVVMLAVTPSLPFDLVPTGQLGIVPNPGFLAHSGFIADKCLVNTKDVPLASARTTTWIGLSGSFTPGLVFVIKGSFHFLTFPRKIPAVRFPAKFQIGDTLQVI